MLVAVAFVPVVKICKVDHEFDNPFILSKLTKVIGNRSSSSLPERRSEAERHLNAAGVVAALAIFLRRGWCNGISGCRQSARRMSSAGANTTVIVLTHNCLFSA
jgi:hypothetical protein